MKKLEDIKHKDLVLENVICEKVQHIKMEEVNTYIVSFLNRLQLLNVKTSGKLITKMCGYEFAKNGEMRVSYELIIEVLEDCKEYQTLPCYTHKNCLFLHYEGLQLDFEMANLKLQLYMFENEFVSEGIVYTYTHMHKDQHLIADIYVPIVEETYADI